MRIVDPVPFGTYDSGLRDVRLSKAEVATLTRAARILHTLRGIIERECGEESGVDIALAAYTVEDIAKVGRVTL